MNENTTFERDVAEAFDRESRGRPVPDAIHDELLTYAGKTRQWPGWLASIKEPPMRLSDSLAVGSPTVRVLAVLAATVLLALALAAAGVAGQRLLAADYDHLVDAGGGGDFTTIAEAVAAAQDGEVILIKDGTYTESVEVTKDITIRGESRDGVVIEFGAGCRLEGEGEFWWEKERVCDPGTPELDGLPNTLWAAGTYGLHLDDSNAQVTDLTFLHRSPGYGIYVTGGAPTIERVTYLDNRDDNPNGGNNLLVRGGAAATVRQVDLGRGSVGNEEQSPSLIEENVLGGVFSEAPRGSQSDDPAVIRNNSMSAMIWAEGPHLIEGNQIDLTSDQFESPGIFVNGASGWTVRGNTVRNSSHRGIDVGDQAGDGVVVDNILEGNATGILTSSLSHTEIEGNQITGGDIGIRVMSGSVGLVDNTIEGAAVNGMVLAADATLTGNVACGNEVDMMISRLAGEVLVDETNEICEINDLRAE
jgi:parallel beta-helix repeat protein